MDALRSLRRWANPEVPSSTSYAALARYGLRRTVPVAVPVLVCQIVLLVPAGASAFAAFLVGTVVAGAFGYVGGVAVAFDDRGRAALAGVASVGVLLGAGAGMRAFGPAHVRDLVVGMVCFAAVVPLAIGVGGYTFAERATWRATD
jgi:hypothetical protein